MRQRCTPAARSFAAARAAAAHARGTGSGIGEASAAVAAGESVAGPSRRRFLEGSLAAGAGAALPAWLPRPASPGRRGGRRPGRQASRRAQAGRVVIIGAGIAGLGCAYRLWQEHGIASEVYEYNAARAGGRLYTLRGFFDGGQYAEEHAELISSEHLATRQLARSFGLVLDDVASYPAGSHPQQTQFRFGGENWSQQALDRDWHAWAWRLFHDAAFRQAPWPTLHDRGSAQARRQAIRAEPLGSNSKIQMQFSSRVWNADGWTANLYTDEIVQGAWETTIDQPGPHGILIALPGGATGADIGRRYRLPSYYGPAPAAMVADYLRCYEQFWPGIGAAYNGKAYYAWSSGDPHIGGAYSYLKPGQYKAFNGMQGRQRGSLHFAGEHTSVNYQGYIEGALRSGYRCALEITG